MGCLQIASIKLLFTLTSTPAHAQSTPECRSPLCVSHGSPGLKPRGMFAARYPLWGLEPVVDPAPRGRGAAAVRGAERLRGSGLCRRRGEPPHLPRLRRPTPPVWAGSCGSRVSLRGNGGACAGGAPVAPVPVASRAGRPRIRCRLSAVAKGKAVPGFCSITGAQGTLAEKEDSLCLKLLCPEASSAQLVLWRVALYLST